MTTRSAVHMLRKAAMASEGPMRTLIAAAGIPELPNASFRAERKSEASLAFTSGIASGEA